jgi:hypothetical protein
VPRRARIPRSSTQTSLRLGLAAERIAGLRRERDRLADKIGKKRAELDERVEAMRQAADAVFQKMPVLIEQQRALSAEVHALFAELLKGERLPRRQRRAVLDVYEVLKDEGLLDMSASPLDPDGNEDQGENEFDAEWAAAFGDEPPSARAPGSGKRASGHAEGAGSERYSPGGGFSATHAGAQSGKESVRQLFRRLAIALHPDRTQHDAEKLRRTEAMKEVTRAYEEGDLARLIQIENTFLAGAVIPSQSEEDDQRQIAALERMVADLGRQLKQVERELREVRRSSPLEGLEEVMPELRFSDSPLETLLARAEQDLRELESVRDFVKSFRDGRITLAEFLVGPERAQYERESYVPPGVPLEFTTLFEDFEPVKRPAPRKKKSPPRPRKKKPR